MGSRGELIPLLPHLHIFHDSKHLLISLHFTLPFLYYHIFIVSILTTFILPSSPSKGQIRPLASPPRLWKLMYYPNITLLSTHHLPKHNFIHTADSEGIEWNRKQTIHLFLKQLFNLFVMFVSPFGKNRWSLAPPHPLSLENKNVPSISRQKASTGYNWFYLDCRAYHSDSSSRNQVSIWKNLSIPSTTNKGVWWSTIMPMIVIWKKIRLEVN